MKRFTASSTINILIIRPQSPEPRQKQLIDNSSISEHGGLSRALTNFQSICDHNGLYMAFLKQYFSPEIAVAAICQLLQHFKPHHNTITMSKTQQSYK